MIFKGTKLPNEVSLALDKGELIIFVGAGISKPPPSNFPLFDGLVVEVGKLFGIVKSPEEVRGKEDKILGLWKEKKHDVHKAIANILSNEKSKPTQLHYELFRIFQESKKVRIVTTNFDNHLTDAARFVFPNCEIDKYYAPALPLGDDFEGIVYLHGSINQKHERMVLTTEDFGKAYFSKGWAREFLLSLFSRYTVLFVGYSHSDVLVSYIAYGLKHAGVKPRCSLISSSSTKDERENWKRLGVLIQEYPYNNNHPENPHISLTEFFKEWVIFVKESILERANKLKLTTKNKLPENDELAEYIDFCIQDPRLAQEFCNSLEDEEWISWMEQRGYFKSFFNDKKQSEDWNKKLEANEKVIACWLCSFVRKRYPLFLLELLEKNNQEFNDDFADIFANEIWTKQDEFYDPRFNTWMILLINKGPKILPPIIWSYILMKCKISDNKIVALKLLEFLTTPELHLKKPFGILFSKEVDESQRVDYEIKWPYKADHWIKKIWINIFKPAIPELADELMALAVKQLSFAHLLLKGVGKANEYFDNLSWSRKSITPHEQNHDQMHLCLSVLLDTAREILEHWLKNDKPKGKYHITVFNESKIPLLKRLAIHGVGLDDSMSANDKIKWLLDKDLIYASGMKKEIFDVLKVSYSSASHEIRLSLIDYIKKGIKNKKLEHKTTAYEKFNFLTWLKRSDESCDLLRNALREISQEYPYFSEREHPEFDSWIGKVGFIDPREGFDFDKILSDLPLNYIDSILGASETSIYKDKWDHLGNLKVLFERNRSWAKGLMENLVSREIDDRQIWEGVFYAWREIIKSQEDWNWILEVIESLPENRNIYASATNLISNGFWKKESKVINIIIGKGYKLISKAWNLCKNDYSEIDEASEDILSSAINHEGGWIGEFWIHYISHLRQKAKDNWKGIPKKIKKQIIEAVQGTGKTSIYARIAIIPWAAYLFVWDELFAKTYLIPLFDWDINSSTAKQTWSVYIGYRRLAHIEMEKMLIPNYKQLVRQLNIEIEWRKSLEESNFLDNLGFHFAGLSMRVISDPLKSGFISEVIPLLPEDVLASMASGMGDILKELKPEEQKEKWDLWIKEYIKNRVNGIPTEFVYKETRNVVEWCLHLGDLFPESVDLLETIPLEQVFAYSHTKDILDSPLLDMYPDEACHFCVIVMNAEDYPSLHDHLFELLKKFEGSIRDSRWLAKFEEELYKRGWNPDDN